MTTQKVGSVFGGMLLIAGSCIGAGMLALPILTGVAGFIPSMVMFFIAWAFMTLTGLLLVEVNGWFERRVNLLSMLNHTLGPIGKALGWLLYLFLFYALLVAYISASGNHVSSLFLSNFGITFPDWLGSLFFVLLFGWIVYLGTRPVDLLNRFLMIGKIAAYLGLVIFGIKFVTPHLLTHTEIQYSFFSLPVLIISFGFHNMIPSLSHYLKNDVKRVRQSILGGSFFTLLIYIIWEIIALGILPPEVIGKSYAGDIDAAAAIKSFLGTSVVGEFAGVLAFFAILTSFLAQSLSLSHFLGDGLKVKAKKRENPWMCVLALLPPLLLAFVNPQLFFQALNFAGGICAVVLFGVFPALMVWIGRYKKEIDVPYRVKGGKALLLFILFFAIFILIYQLSTMMGMNLFPHPTKLG